MKKTNKKTIIVNTGNDVEPQLNDIKAQLLDYRKKHFEVKVETDARMHFKLEDKEINLSITGNGYQWNTIRLLSGEIERVIEALKPYVPQRKEESVEGKD